MASKVTIDGAENLRVLDVFNGSSALKNLKAGSVVWDFAACPPISSYIYGLCAGEYHQIDY